jgi:ribonuclease III
LRLDELQKIFGIQFKDPSVLEQALVHDSYVNENPEIAPASNERLEFLGDAVLGLIVTRKLYQDFPDYDEGKMTSLRAALVRRDTLARMAETIGLGQYLYLGKGEEGSGGRSKIPNLAGAMEAVIGAIFLDRGIRETTRCTWQLMQTEYDTLRKTGLTSDNKSRLQELIQAKHQQTPIYTLTEVTGPDHARWFTVEVRLGKAVLGRGSGKTKKTAESEAARDALERIPDSKKVK